MTRQENEERFKIVLISLSIKNVPVCQVREQ